MILWRGLRQRIKVENQKSQWRCERSSRRCFLLFPSSLTGSTHAGKPCELSIDLHQNKALIKDSDTLPFALSFTYTLLGGR